MPFLLFCVGLDPKGDLSVLSNFTTSSPTPSSLYKLLSTPNPEKRVTNYPFNPSSKMVNTGCVAMVIFLGGSFDEISDSIITNGRYNVNRTLYTYKYFLTLVPPNVCLNPFSISIVPSLLVFMEGCLSKDIVSLSLFGRSVYCIVECTLTSLKDCTEGALNRTAVYHVSDLLVRSKDILSAQQLMVSLIDS